MILAIIRLPMRLPRWMKGASARQAQNLVTAFTQIWANKGRSILTTVGIIIAVTSIITVVSFVEGFGGYMTRMLRGYGTQFFVVRPRWFSEFEQAAIGRVTMDINDIEAVRTECSHVVRLSPFVYTGQSEVKYGRGIAQNIPLRGVSQDYQLIRNFHADAGRFFGPIDVETGAHVCVLGRTLLKLLECDERIVGDFITIDGQRFDVIGLLEPKGSFFGEDQDETIMIPYTTAGNLHPELRLQLPFLVEAESVESIDDATAQIRRVLRRRHGLRPEQPDDFFIERQDEFIRQFENFRSVSTASLAGIVSISLLVGGIGIMNVMLVSVTERTREIGLRKSLGAGRRDIMSQFLTEAVVLCTTGGAIGVALGYMIVAIATEHPRMVELHVPAWSVALALGFSVGAGLLFGILPAFKAAIMHPIDALRHE